MEHARLLVHRCVVDDVEVPVRLATLVVVRREGQDALDWEVVAETVDDTAPRLGRNELALTVVTGVDAGGAVELAEVRGEAQVVRFVERSVVWRGDAPLLGFEDAWLA
jgi:predicted HAD superfamily phosphohydrolase